MRLSILVAIALLSSAAPSRAQTRADLSGHWDGGIQTPEISISDSAGQLAGTISVPPQKLKGLPLVIESAEGQTIHFRFKGAPGNRLFQGVISEDGGSIRGSFIQSGYTMPFTLSRAGQERSHQQGARRSVERHAGRHLSERHPEEDHPHARESA